MGKIIKRCCEPIDDLRLVACRAIGQLLNSHKELLNDKIEDWEFLCKVFITEKEEEFTELDWLHAKAFTRLKSLLNSNAFNEFALEGFIMSTGLS